MMFIATKVVYDSIFTRYEGSRQETTLQRAEHRFACGENTLMGYHYQGTREGLVVWIPGFRAGADEYLAPIQSLNENGWGVFAFDTTGSGSSGGESAVGFSQVLEDTEAALDYLAENGNLGYDKVFLLGHSRGGYAACALVDSAHDIAGVVSISGVNSAMEAVIQPATDYVGPFAYGNYPFLWLYQSMLFGTETVGREAAERIKDSDTPVLIVQGSADETAPMDEASIYSYRDELGEANVQYYLCTQPGQNGHTDLMYELDGSANALLMQRIHSFLQEHNE